jgi:hypothetical protein
MKLNYFTKRVSIVGRWLATTLFCVSAIAFIWQGAFFSNTAAMADTSVNLIASAGDRVQDKVSEDAGRAKGFIRDTADKVERTAKKNAEKVNQADKVGNAQFTSISIKLKLIVIQVSNCLSNFFNI